MTVNLQTNLNELDTLLADLNSSKFNDFENRSVSNSYCDYYSEIDLSMEDFKNTKRSSHSIATLVTRKPKRPPKLMHVLKGEEKNKIHDLAMENRQNDLIDTQMVDEEDYGDYTSKWEYLGKGLWENQDYGTLSNYSTLRNIKLRDDYDYSTLSKSPLPNVSEDELEKETGAGPRGERSKFIPTDHGEVKSKYHYLGFGLWENTDPFAKNKPRKPSPPPPPPKAEAVWYSCTVAVSSNLSSKELDDTNMENCFKNMQQRYVEVGYIDENLKQLCDPIEYFDKEDMSDMFKRAMFEKMDFKEEDKRKRYNCFVCQKLIQSRVITALGKKYHYNCFVCTYCRKEFVDKKFKTDPRDGYPYCYLCFEKLLGHYGNAHGML